MLTKDKTHWAYAASAVDMDGCICISRTILKTSAGNPYYGYDLKISIANTFEPIHEWLVSKFGGEYRPKSKNSSKLSDEPGWEWFVCGGYKKLEVFILGILPYLIIKREQALTALEFIRLDGKPNPAKRAELHAKCISLNSGKSLETNTSGTSKMVKIESDLIGDYKSESVVTLTS
jgi:hypothetical protein